jgi:hypothetical protein
VTGLAIAERLRRAAEILAAADDPEVAPVAAALCRYIEGAADGARLDRELGLIASPGATPWWERDRLARRDDAIRKLAASFPGSASAKAAEVGREIAHYAGTCWTRDRARGGPYPDSPRRRLLFDLFTADPTPPSGFRRLFDIINS